MVAHAEVRASNARIATTFPPGLVAVFVGGTSGIGEYALRQFAKQARRPRVYFLGRSQEAGDRIAAECKASNAQGEFTFIKADVSLLRNVDAACAELRRQVDTINLLFLTPGVLDMQTETSEGLPLALALGYYARLRFVVNLLPLIRRATQLRRVVTVLGATKEGPFDVNDIQGRNMSMLAARGHGATLVTLGLEAAARTAPNVSFIHDYPGPVRSGIDRGSRGLVIGIMITIFKVVGPLIYIPNEESGDYHLFFATSSRYPAKSSEKVDGVSLEGGVKVASGADGKRGSGMYIIDERGEPAGAKVEALLAKYREEGAVEAIWKHTNEEFKRITGREVA